MNRNGLLSAFLVFRPFLQMGRRVRTRRSVGPEENVKRNLTSFWLTVPTAAQVVMGLFHSRAVTIWRKESDGEWRCAVDIWNTGP